MTELNGQLGAYHAEGALVGVIAAKQEGVSLIGTEQQSDRYAAG